MAGNQNSGRRGRPTKTNEDFRLATIDKCWKLLSDNLDNPELDLKFRLELASKLAVKSVPTELTGGFSAEVVAMGTIEKIVDGVKTDMTFNIGVPLGQTEPTQDS